MLKNIARILEVLANNPETTAKETQTAQKLKELLIELEKIEKPETSKEKKAEGGIFGGGEVTVRDVVLNTERTWSDAVRAPAVISVDLLARAMQLCEDNPMLSKIPVLFGLS